MPFALAVLIVVIAAIGLRYMIVKLQAQVLIAETESALSERFKR